jgi:hypothetical protein
MNRDCREEGRVKKCEPVEMGSERLEKNPPFPNSLRSKNGQVVRGSQSSTGIEKISTGCLTGQYREDCHLRGENGMVEITVVRENW